MPCLPGCLNRMLAPCGDVMVMTPSGSFGIWRSSSVGLRAAPKEAHATSAARCRRGAMVKADPTQENAKTGWEAPFLGQQLSAYIHCTATASRLAESVFPARVDIVGR